MIGITNQWTMKPTKTKCETCSTGSLSSMLSTPLLKMASLLMIWVAVAERASPTSARHASARILSASVSGVLVWIS